MQGVSINPRVCGRWNVSVTTGAGKNILSVFQIIGRKFRLAECDGMNFATSDEAFDYAERMGFLHRFGRNTSRFAGNRSYRRHKGSNYDPTHYRFRRAS